jgi:hypothetical protein
MFMMNTAFLALALTVSTTVGELIKFPEPMSFTGPKLIPGSPSAMNRYSLDV